MSPLDSWFPQAAQPAVQQPQSLASSPSLFDRGFTSPSLAPHSPTRRVSAVQQPAVSSRAACLRPSSLEASPLEVLRAVGDALKGQAVCVLAHEQEYGTTALYVHSSRPLDEALSPKLLLSVDIQPQRATVFALIRPYDGSRIQAAMNSLAATHVGFNAAIVHTNSDLLTIFEDSSSQLTSQVPPSRYSVCVVFTQDVCPVGEPGTATGRIEIQGGGNAQELQAVYRALMSRPEVAANSVTVSCGSSAITVEPRKYTELLVVKDVVLETLRDIGLPHELARNNVVLFQQENEVTIKGCSTEIEIAPADNADGSRYADLSPAGVVSTILPELGYAGSPRTGPNTFAFDLAGLKCTACAQALLQSLLQTVGQSNIVKVSLSLTRSVLLVTSNDDHTGACVQHVISVLRSMQVPATLLFGGPSEQDVVGPEVMQFECQVYAQALQSLRAVGPPGGSTTVLEVALRPSSVSCPTCANLLQKTLSNMLLALRNVAVDHSRSVLLVELVTELIGEAELVSTLASLGYQPQVVQAGKHLLPALHDLLRIRSTLSTVPIPTPEVTKMVEAPSVDSLSSMGCVAAYTAKVSFALGQPPTSTILMLGSKNQVPVEDAETKYDLYFLNSPSEPAVRVDLEPSPVYLEKEYTIWYDKVVDRSKPNAPECNLVELESFNTVQDFWRAWQKFDLFHLQEGDVIMVFRNHVQPNIHHPVNKGGGRWYTRALPLETRGKLWTGLVLAMLGENLEDNTNNEVSGVVLSVKPGGDRIEVWVDGDYHHHAKHGHDNVPLHRQLSPTMGDILARVLSLNPGRHRLHYWTHVAYERHRKLHSGSARRDKRKHKMAVASQGARPGPGTP